MSAAPDAKVELADGAACVALVGEHDLGTRERVQAAVDGALGNGLSLVLDLRRTEFMDSVVAGLLLEARKEAKRRNLGLGVVLSDSPTNQVRRLFELSGLTSVFAVYDSREAALGGVRAGFVESAH
jgi:anti-anti-sigma factor